MAGYSGTPLPRKLGIKDGHRVAILNPPADFDATLGDLPDGTEVRTSARGSLDVVVCFLTARSGLEQRFDSLRRAIFPDGGLGSPGRSAPRACGPT